MVSPSSQPSPSAMTNTGQAPPTDTKKRLALAIIDFLNTSLKDGTISNEDAVSILEGEVLQRLRQYFKILNYNWRYFGKDE